MEIPAASQRPDNHPSGRTLADTPLAADLRGFGPYGLLAIAFIVLVPWTLLKAVAVLIWASWSHTPWSELGFVRSANWLRTAAIGVTLGVGLKFLMKAVVLPLLGAEPVNAAYHYLAGNTAALPAILFTVIVGAGFGEETVFRGYLFERLGKLLGRSIRATTVIVLFTAGLFGLVHYPDQGLAGVQQGTIVGLISGSIFAVTGRLWMLIIAHAAFDVTAVAIIYWDVESEVAGWIFG